MSQKTFETGYTAGAFDLFHVGHLRFLQRAAKLCDRLIVGVSTTESMKKYKGIEPVISFEHRCEILKSLSFIHEVIPNDTIEHEITSKRLGFEVFIIGDDWCGRLPENICCPTVYLPRTKDICSTDIKARILCGL